jgi:hypothetical protein
MSTNTHSDTTQFSIDQRLDAIDRALLGSLPRHDRVELVEQIETKLREFAEANPPLGSEPAEAVPDRSERFNDAVDAAVSSPAVRMSELARRTFSRRRPRSRLALSSGILGIAALALLVALPFVYLVASLLDSSEWLTVWLLGGNVMALALGGLSAVAMGIAALVVLNRHEGRLVGHGWAVTGLCTGPLPMLVGVLVALVLGAELHTTVSVTPAYTTNTVPPPGPLSMNPGVYPYQQQGAPVPNYSAPSPTPVGATQSPQGFDPYGAPPTYMPGTPASPPPYVDSVPSLSGTPQAEPAVPSVPETRTEITPPTAPAPSTSSPPTADAVDNEAPPDAPASATVR